jgi:hypothetical protein
MVGSGMELILRNSFSFSNFLGRKKENSKGRGWYMGRSGLQLTCAGMRERPTCCHNRPVVPRGCGGLALLFPPAGGLGEISEAIDSFGLSATSQQYFSLRTNQPPATRQQYFSLRRNHHKSPATSQTNRLRAAANQNKRTSASLSLRAEPPAF